MNIAELIRKIQNLIRTGVVIDVSAEKGCRVKTGDNETDWRPWLTARAGHSRSWWAPSIGEQVLLLSIGGDLTTSFVLPAIFSDDFSEPSTSLTAHRHEYEDGAVIEYEPATGALTVTGIKTAVIEASESVTVTSPEITCIAESKITLDTPTVICTNNLTTGSLTVQKGGTMTGDITHVGGQMSSNGVVVATHTHGGVRTGDGNTGQPQRTISA